MSRDTTLVTLDNEMCVIVFHIVCYDGYEKLVIPIIGVLPFTVLQLKVTFGTHCTEEATSSVAVVSDFFTRTLVERTITIWTHGRVVHIQIFVGLSATTCPFERSIWYK